MRYLIGIDDTDNPDSRGTGFRARQAKQLRSGGEILGHRPRLAITDIVNLAGRRMLRCSQTNHGQIVGMDAVGRWRFLVITSYSIHYTKLYERVVSW